MRKDVYGLTEWVFHIKPSDTPRLIYNAINY